MVAAGRGGEFKREQMEMWMAGKGCGERAEQSCRVREQDWQKDAHSVAVAWGAGCREREEGDEWIDGL